MANAEQRTCGRDHFPTAPGATITKLTLRNEPDSWRRNLESGFSSYLRCRIRSRPDEERPGGCRTQRACPIFPRLRKIRFIHVRAPAPEGRVLALLSKSRESGERRRNFLGEAAFLAAPRVLPFLGAVAATATTSQYLINHVRCDRLFPGLRNGI